MRKQEGDFLSKDFFENENRPLRPVKFGIVSVIVFGIYLILRDTEGVSEFTVSNKSDFPWRGTAVSVVRGFGILGKYVRKNS